MVELSPVHLYKHFYVNDQKHMYDLTQYIEGYETSPYRDYRLVWNKTTHQIKLIDQMDNFSLIGRGFKIESVVKKVIIFLNTQQNIVAAIENRIIEPVGTI